MPSSETLLEMAERDVCEGEERIERQRKLIDKLADDGHPTDEALAFLQELQKAQLEHITQLERLRKSAGGWKS